MRNMNEIRWRIRNGIIVTIKSIKPQQTLMLLKVSLKSHLLTLKANMILS